MNGVAPSVAELSPLETPQLQSCRELARKHLGQKNLSLFHELTGLWLQAVWEPSWSPPAVCSRCRHPAATLVPGGGCGVNDGNSADALKPQQEPNFSTCKLGVRHQWHPMIVQGYTLGFLYIQTLDDLENRSEDRTRESVGGRQKEAPKSPRCPSDALVTRLGTMQRERAGMLLKLVAANVESATLAELQEAALSQARLDFWEHRYEDRSLKQTLRLQMPDSPVKGAIRQTCPHYQQIVQRMLDYLQSHYHLPIQLVDVANALKMNACYLSSLFSATTGVTYHRYLQELRLAKAKQLLADPGTLIGEVAGATGFASAGTFCRNFKALTGLSPRAWRDGDQAEIDNHS